MWEVLEILKIYIIYYETSKCNNQKDFYCWRMEEFMILLSISQKRKNKHKKITPTDQSRVIFKAKSQHRNKLNLYI